MQNDGQINDIVVIGELNVDLIASGVQHAPEPGKEVLADDFEITLGSASAIFASGIARLGRGVTFIGCVGDDEFGEFCIDALRNRGISVDNVERRKDVKTGVTVVLSTPKDRAMVTYVGAIAELGIDDISVGALDGHRHLHLTSYFLQTKLRPDFVRLITEARNRGLTISFDPNSDPTQVWHDSIYDVLRLADILFLNEIEAKQLTLTDDVHSAIKDLVRVSRCPVIKLGSAGAIAANENELVSVGGFSVTAVDTTGAGDTFAAGFVHAYLEGQELRDCLIMGSVCGSLSTTRVGGTGAQPNLQQAREFIEASQASASKGETAAR